LHGRFFVQFAVASLAILRQREFGAGQPHDAERAQLRKAEGMGMIKGFKHIMFPVDFSAHGDQAGPYAAWFAEVSQGTVHLVHVIGNPADPIYEPEKVSNWVMVEHAEKQAQELIEKAAQECLPASCPRELHILHGDPYQKLMEATEQIKPDLIVMSTHGRGGIAHLVIGSVAEKVVRHAACPVFVVHRQE
jgi:nucleotide-binding universal stress UspA family protein